jgi:hypothetical protein
MTNTEAKPSNSRGGRLRAPQKRPHIQVPGDELWPTVDIAGSAKRALGNAVGYVAGVAYTKVGIAWKMLANRFLATNRRGRR